MLGLSIRSERTPLCGNEGLFGHVGDQQTMKIDAALFTTHYFEQRCTSRALPVSILFKPSYVTKLPAAYMQREYAISMFEFTGRTILQGIIYKNNYLGEGCCKKIGLSFLNKIVDRFPVEFWSIRNCVGYTAYRYLYSSF